MTLPAEPIFVTFVGDGIVTAFEFDKRVYVAEELSVFLYDAAVDTVPQLVDPADYTVAIVGVALDPDTGEPTIPLDAQFDGATVTFTVAPASGVKVGILRTIGLTQEVTLNTSYVRPTELEKSLDKLTLLAQQVSERGARLSTADPFDFTAAARAGKTLKFNATGTGIEYGAASSSGDVVGPASVTDDLPAIFDGTTGKLLKQKTYAAFKTLLALVKGDVGLGNADNTADTAKPVSTAQQTALDAKVAGPASVTDDLPAIFDGTTGKLIKQKTYAAFKTLLALVKGDVGLGNADNTSDAAKPVSTAQQTALDAKVAGPASVTDDLPAIFDGTTGKLIKQKTYAAFKTLLVLVKGDVGLGSVDNTSDAGKPVSTAQQTALDLKANLASPTLTGTPAAPTAAPGTNTTQISTTAFVKAAIDVVLGGVSAAFDTLSEIATELGLKAPLASPAFTGVPTAPTAAADTSTTQLATTAFAKAEADAAQAASQPLDADLTAVAALAATGLAARTAADTWVQRSIAVTASTGLSVSNGDGVAGNPTLAGIDASQTVKGVSELATAAEFRTGTDTGRALVVDQVWASAAEVTLTDGASIAVDFATFINAVVTLAGNRALANPTNEKVGQTGYVRIVQDATGTRTLSYGTDWEFAGGTAPVLSTAANDQDMLFYVIIAVNRVFASLVKDIS